VVKNFSDTHKYENTAKKYLFMNIKIRIMLVLKVQYIKDMVFNFFNFFLYLEYL
jgi:hypothetical protein